MSSLRAFAAQLVLGLLAALGPAGAQAAEPAQRPNIVFVLIDDAGFSDLGSYGSEIATPTLDAIAREGVRFTNFHTASTCEASRVMLHSGVDSHRAGAGTLQAVIADNQKGKPGYEGYLSDRAHSLGQLMRDGGYATYFAGKWNIGDGTLARTPGARGWDRYVGLEATGADNYEAKVYAPLNLEAVWYEDGQRAELPPDFYSSRHYVDKLIRFIDEGRAGAAKDKPFFATLSLQAVHSPLQAPDAAIARYAGRYDAGWNAIRAERYQRQVQMGLMPPGLTMPVAPAARPWSALDAGERARYAKKMAVFAGMLTEADTQVGRLREHLQRIGEAERTVWIVMSDNGADAYDLSTLNLPFRLWYRVNYALGIEQMGARGSYVHYGQDWAAVSNTPLALFKGSSAEGGMRVPFIVAAPQRVKGGGTTNAFAFATDFLPTVLDLAGIALPGDEYRGRKLHRPTGLSLMPHLEGKAAAVHASDEAIGFESTGGQALFQGDWKLMFNARLVVDGAVLSDGVWHLYKLGDDPTESRDLAAAEPERVKAMTAELERFKQREGVVLPEPGYDAFRQLATNNWRVLLRQLGPVMGVALVAVALVAWGLLRGVRALRGRARAG